MTLEDPISLTINVTQTDPCVGEFLTYSVSNSQSKKITWQFFPDDFNIHGISDTTLTGEHRTAGSKVVRASQIYKGCLSQTDSRNKVKVIGPESRFMADKTISCFNKETIRFTNQSIEPVGSLITYKWYVKDSVGLILDSALSKDYTFQFDGFGRYSVTLISFSNITGCSDTLEKVGYIQLKSLKALANVDPNVACISQSVEFQNATLAGSSNSPNLYKWEIFDKNMTSLKTSSQDTFEYSFLDTGFYSFSLVVYNTLGCYDSIFKRDSVHIIKPTVQVHISDSTPCKGQKITVDASHNKDLDGLIHYWYFTNKTYPDVANDAALIGDSGDVTFKVPGIYDYSYIYYARIGPACKDTFIGKGKVKVSGTDIDVTTSNDDDCIPLVTNLSSSVVRTQNHKNLYSNFSYQWKAGDPSIQFTTPQNASTQATMSQRGIRYVSLVYRDKSGCKDSTPLIPHSAGIIANFATAPQACLNGLTRMTNTSSLNP